MFHRTLLVTLLLGGLSVVGHAQSSSRAVRRSAAAPAVPGGVRVVLPDQVAVRYEQVRLGDVATIQADDGGWKRRLSELEIAEVRPGQTRVAVRKSRISILIRLAGLPAERLIVNGPDVVQVEFDPPVALTDADVEQQARDTFPEVMGGTSQDLRVQLTAPFLATLPEGIRERKGLRVEVAPPRAGRLGRISTTVRLWDGGEMVASRSVPFDVRKRQKVAVVLSSLRRDEPVTARHVRIENRFVEKLHDEPTEADLLGKSARRDLQPGQVLSLADLKAPQRQTTLIAVRARETIEVEAVSGALRVRLQAATALQTGRVGDVIQFKNPDSGHTRAGRIVGPGRVQVKL